MYNLLCIFLIFMIYSLLGYVVEILFCSLNSKKLVWNRGFLIGPYLPIYGVGAIVISAFLSKYSHDTLALFTLSMVYCSVLEYLTSYILEKIFKLRWWDYSHERFNVNGRICLTNGVLFGLGGVLIIQIINPILKNFIYNINPYVTTILATILFIIFLTDIIVSVRIIYGLKTNIKRMTKRDSTDQIKKEVVNFLKNYHVLTGRLLKSFPDLEKLNGKNTEKFIKTFSKVKSDINKLKRGHK